MATLPTSRDLGYSEVRPALGVASGAGPTGEEGGAARGNLIAAGQLEEVSHILEKARSDYSQVQAQDAVNRYQKALLEKRQGWEQVKGQDALKPEFLKDTIDVFDQERNKISDGIDDPKTKIIFNQHAQVTALSNQANLMEHVSKQRLAYNKQTYDDTRAIVINGLGDVTGSQGLANVTLAIQQLQDNDRRYYGSMGANEDTLKVIGQKTRDDLIAHVVNRAAVSDNPLQATEVFNTYKDQMSNMARTDLQVKLRRELMPQEALVGANEIVAKTIADVDPDKPGGKPYGNFVGDPEQAKTAIMKIGDPAERARALQAWESQYKYPDSTPQSRDLRAKLGDMRAEGAKYAEKTHPGDALFAQHVDSAITSKANTIIAAQEGIQKQAHDTAIKAALGAELPPEKRLTSWNQFTATVGPDVVSKMDANTQHATLNLLEQNAKALAGEFTKTDPATKDFVWSKVRSGDITSISQLSPFLATSTQAGLNRMDYDWFQHQIKIANEDRPLTHKLNQAEKDVRAGAALLHPMDQYTASGIGFAWRDQANKMIEQYKKDGKDPNSLFDQNNKDYLLDPKRIEGLTYGAKAETPTVIPPMPAVDKLPKANTAEEVLAMQPGYVWINDGAKSGPRYWNGKQLLPVRGEPVKTPAKAAKPSAIDTSAPVRTWPLEEQ